MKLAWNSYLKNRLAIYLMNNDVQSSDEPEFYFLELLSFESIFDFSNAIKRIACIDIPGVM